jgi:hypothetical protein
MDDLTPNTWGEIVAILTIVGVALAAIDWRIRLHIDNRLHTVRDQLREEIQKATQPIRPGYRNNGESLADVAHELRRVKSHLGIED